MLLTAELSLQPQSSQDLGCFLFCFYFCLFSLVWFGLVWLTTVPNDPEHKGLKQHTLAIALQPQRSEVQSQTPLPKVMVPVGRFLQEGLGSLQSQIQVTDLITS